MKNLIIKYKLRFFKFIKSLKKSKLYKKNSSYSNYSYIKSLLLELKKMTIGFISGFVSGFFSTGGGLILVPAFIYLLGKDPKKSRGTAIFCILPMVVTSSIFYQKGNYIEWNTSFLCAFGGAIGGYIGAKLLKKLPEKKLKFAFLIFILYISYKMLFN